MKKERYIGITGFKTTDEVWRACTYFKVAEDDAYHTYGSTNRLMLGILSSSKRLSACLRGEDSEGSRSPKISDIPGLLHAIPDYQRIFPVIHYHSQNPRFASEIATIMSYHEIFGDGLCRAVQLNMTWPDAEEVKRLSTVFPGMEIILPITGKAIRTMTPKKIAEKTAEYSGFADYILVDASGGAGIEMDPAREADIIGSLKDALPGAMLGVAGGLHSGNLVERLDPVTERFGTDICIDAEGRLRTPDGNALEHKACTSYIDAALGYFGWRDPTPRA